MSGLLVCYAAYIVCLFVCLLVSWLQMFRDIQEDEESHKHRGGRLKSQCFEMIYIKSMLQSLE